MNIRLFFTLGTIAIAVSVISIVLYSTAHNNFKKLDQTPKVYNQTPAPSSLAVLASGSANVNVFGPEKGNFLVNPSFEKNDLSWYSHENWKTNFEYSEIQSKSGRTSAYLELDSQKSASQGGSIHGVVQDITPKVFPNYASGYYYVENWQKATKNQYLQMVIIVFDPDNIPKEIESNKNYQIRYILAGQVVPPDDFKNAKYITINSKDPKKNEWVFFERNIEEDFKKQWGDIPKKFSSIRVFFEARWDGRTNTTPLRALVYYDDLFLGVKN